MNGLSHVNASFPGLRTRKSKFHQRFMMKATPPKTTIRHCLYRDLDGIVPIYSHYAIKTFASLDPNPKTVSQLQQVYDTVLDEELPFLVVSRSREGQYASLEDRIIGYAYATRFRRLTSSGNTVECIVYVHPDYTRSGHGGRLLQNLLTMLRPSMRLGVGEENGTIEVLAIVPVDEGADSSKCLSS